MKDLCYDRHFSGQSLIVFQIKRSDIYQRIRILPKTWFNVLFVIRKLTFVTQTSVRIQMKEETNITRKSGLKNWKNKDGYFWVI